MSDTNLDPSISALSTRATEVAASASPRELLNLSRIAPSLEQSENAGLEVAINSRAAGLAPSATATELKSIGKAIGNVLEPDTFTAGAFIPAQLDQSGKFLGTSGTSKNWSGVTVSGLSEVNISDIANDETLVYNNVSSQFENSSQVFNIPQYAQTADLPASATSGATAFDLSTAELKYWDGSEWKVAAVVAAAGGGAGKIVIGAPFDDDNGDNTGAVYVYDAADLSAQPTKLVGELAGDRFGVAVAVTSDKIIVGAQYNPMGPQTTTSRIGAVYAYDMNDLSAQPTKLVPSDVISSIGDNPYHTTEFGKVIVTSSDKIYIGHSKYPTEGVGAGSVASNVGAVFVYDANDLSADPIRIDNPETGQFWSDALNQYLPRWENNEFGNSIAISSNYLVVGAHRYGKYTPNDATDAEASSGAVYVYDINNLSAAPTKLTASDGAENDNLGYAVAVSSDVIVASTVNDGGTGTNGDFSGSVYVWDANNLSAAPTKLVAFDATPNSYFGYDIVVSADKIFIATRGGAVYEYDVNNLSAAATKHSPVAHTRYFPDMAIISDKILIGSKTDEGSNWGVSHLYNLTDLSTPINTITAFDGAANDQFGYSVAIGEGSGASSGSGSTGSTSSTLDLSTISWNKSVNPHTDLEKVATYGDLVVIGVRSHTGFRGKAYLYNKSADTTTELVQPSADVIAQGNFGKTVAINDTYIAVLSGENSTLGITGKIYLYDHSGVYQNVRIEGPAQNSGFGTSANTGNGVILSDTYIFVLAHNYANDSAPRCYVYDYTGTEIGYLTTSAYDMKEFAAKGNIVLTGSNERVRKWDVSSLSGSSSTPVWTCNVASGIGSLQILDDDYFLYTNYTDGVSSGTTQAGYMHTRQLSDASEGARPNYTNVTNPDGDITYGHFGKFTSVNESGIIAVSGRDLSGKVYLYSHSGGVLTYETSVDASSTGIGATATFGHTISISENSLVVGDLYNGQAHIFD